MQASKCCDTASKQLTGDIHALGTVPFFVHIYKEQMLNKYKANPTTIHIDAIGSVVRKVRGKTVFCYAIVAEDETMGYPVGMMLSNAHSTATITYFLTRLSEAFKSLHHLDLSAAHHRE